MLKTLAKGDLQYFIPFLICLICFVSTEFVGIIDNSSIAYWSGRIFVEPYRIITYHFFHGDINHLLANISGIIVARFFLKALKLRSDYFFLLFIVLMIPLQTFISWCLDIVFYQNKMSLAIGFSGILFGVYSFILMTTLYGKKRFIFLKCAMKKDFQLFKSILLLIGFGLIWSLTPGISLIGHISGFAAGLLLFII